jgi:hypothetical protein
MVGAMRPWSTLAILLACLGGAATLSAPRASHAGPGGDVEALSSTIRGLVADDRPETADALQEMVARGLPPAGMATLLDAARSTPRVDLLPMLVQLSSYRRPEIRARALVARAALGGAYADRAVAVAADDLELGVRRLALVLGRANSSPVTDEIIADLLAHDAELAAEHTPGADLVPQAGPPAPPEPDPAPEPPPPLPFSHVDPGTPEPIDAVPPAVIETEPSMLATSAPESVVSPSAPTDSADPAPVTPSTEPALATSPTLASNDAPPLHRRSRTRSIATTVPQRANDTNTSDPSPRRRRGPRR